MACRQGGSNHFCELPHGGDDWIHHRGDAGKASPDLHGWGRAEESQEYADPAHEGSKRAAGIRVGEKRGGQNYRDHGNVTSLQ